MTYQGGNGAWKVEMTATQASLDRSPWGKALWACRQKSYSQTLSSLWAYYLLLCTFLFSIKDTPFPVPCP